MLTGHTFRRYLATGSVLLAAAVLAACGSSKKSSSSGAAPASSGTLALTISDAGGTAKYTAPATTKGGLVTVTLKNEGKAPHSAQLALIQGNHTTAEAVKVINDQSPTAKTPSWLRAEGGIGLVLPGQSSSATVVLPAGKYVIAEEPGGPGGKPAFTGLQVTPGPSGSLPSTPTTVTAATAGKERYKWQLSGALHPDANRITFASKGHDAIHVIVAVPISGHPSKAAILKALETNGQPPPFLKVQEAAETAALDGGKSSVTDLNLAAPGRYVLFCPIHDRNGGKPHFTKGLLTTVTVR